MAALLCAVSGCGTTKWSDTQRTATEQMLLSDAIDRAVSEIDFSALEGRDVFLETKYIAGYVDEKYMVATLRQHMLASGCVIKDRANDANYVVEVRAGAVGTNRSDLLFGVPATQLPSGGGVFPVAPTSLPELPLVKRTAQQGVCKLAVFAYDRYSGHPVWQSGNRLVASKAKDVWIFGTGPFQRGTIYEGTKLAGERLQVPLTGSKTTVKPNLMANERRFNTSDVPAMPPTRLPPQAEGPALVSAPAFGEPSPPETIPQQPQPPQPLPPQNAAQPARPNTTATYNEPISSQPPNPAAGAAGAFRALDWAQEFRANQLNAQGRKPAARLP